ncbi:hypothetical protein SAMN06265379_107174 [Saccharicrinis carchari]|uniref:Uncharacterized protein n=1 Tax=Saccharicrinis carchari TaxID=1168039 RepID=A0A521E441_SACCC|nr:hypothetical protein [Saccharicrinis carchari]SMO78708.1 hypothetical protein SAMN06265379_107174 [Saccharicrinis carchari]
MLIYRQAQNNKPTIQNKTLLKICLNILREETLALDAEEVDAAEVWEWDNKTISETDFNFILERPF